MKILAISDMHGDTASARSLVRAIEPQVVVCCGDWGDPGQLTEDDYRWFTDRAVLLTVFGNHDDIELLGTLINPDGTAVVLANGDVRDVRGTTFTGISGIWAKSHAKPHYITDEEVEEAAHRAGHVDILVTHGCAVGLADSFPSGRHGGNRCFLEAFKLAKPRVHLCGHLHAPQTRNFSDGTCAVNVGETRHGDYVLIDTSTDPWGITAGKRPE